MKKAMMALMAIAAAMGTGRAERISLESYAHNLDSLAIAVLPFKSLNDKKIGADEPWKVIADDLDFSGRFMVTRSDSVDTAVFAKKNIPIYIDGNYSVNGSFVVLDGYLRDVRTREPIAEKRLSGEVASLRALAHRLSNEVVEMLFNDKGIFQSKICFVRDEGAVKNIMVMDYDAHHLMQFTNNRCINIFPAFADSATIVWTSF